MKREVDFRARLADFEIQRNISTRTIGVLAQRNAYRCIEETDHGSGLIYC